MTTYREQFDQHTAMAISAIADASAELGNELPGLRVPSMKRLLDTISYFLEYIDKGNVRHPEYLAHSPEIIPQLALSAISNVPNSIGNGAAYFVQNTLPTLLLIEDRLIKAVGIDGHRVKEIKNQQVIDLQGLSDASREVSDSLTKIHQDAAKFNERAKVAAAEIFRYADKAKDQLQAIEKIYEGANQLSSGDARKNSLERLVRTAREKVEIIDSTLKAASDAQATAATHASEARESALEAAGHLTALAATGSQANEILRGATQAGLAGAYKIERDRLAGEQRRYAWVFYGGVVGIILYAAIFIVPIFSQIIVQQDSVKTQLGESALLLLVRIAILAPMVWALIFTSNRYSKLETLQMDYAAKAATALAYSGYRDEMGTDEILSNKLKDGLLVRFLEHPERLLNRSEMKETVGITPEGVSYTSSNAPRRNELPSDTPDG